MTTKLSLKRKPMRGTARGPSLVARLLARLEEGHCTLCDRRIARAEQVGQSMYALPCGHRIAIGNADDYNRGLQLASRR
jgi:hypothetical protein